MPMSTAAQSQPAAGTLFDNLARIVGADHLLTDTESRTFYSTDVYQIVRTHSEISQKLHSI